MDIAECSKEQKYEITLKVGENLGIISQTYDWILPSIVDEFLEKLEIRSEGGGHYVFFIATYGTTTGQICNLAGEHMKEKGFPVTAYYSVQMPDTWTPVFDLSDPEKVRKQNERADRQIQQVIEQITAKKEGDFARRKLPKIVIRPMKANYEKVRQTRHLHVENSCIGCGQCARNCPVQAIEMWDKMPVWVKDQCVMCLRCLHHCPKFAIQYGKQTKKHGQYVHP